MAPRPLRRPAHIPPLSSLLQQPGYSTGGTTVPLSPSPHLVRPAQVVLLVDNVTTAAAKAEKGWNSGMVIGKQPHGRVTKLTGLVLKDTKGDAQSEETVSTSGLKTAVVRLLTSLPPTFPSTQDARKHFALPTLSLGHSVRDDLPAWLDALSLASKQDLTIEFSLEGFGSVKDASPQAESDRLVSAQYEQVEELLSKSFSRDFELSQGGNQDGSESQGKEDPAARFVLDAFGSPPTHLTSTQLLRSPMLQEWAGFCSRIALHPRVFVKLSCPPQSLAKSGGSIERMSTDDRAEFRRVIRIWIDAVLDALGEERLIFAATGLDVTSLPASAVSTSSSSVPEQAVQAVGGSDEDEGAAQTVGGSDAAGRVAKTGEEEDRLTEVELWYEIVREVLADIGIDALAMSKIFETNAIKLYGLP
ncbi:hypothetical protein CF319_g3613 [Tilletia indica]|nr:hypothetical protein CF319_g3613 [Tilletia indica]